MMKRMKIKHQQQQRRRTECKNVCMYNGIVEAENRTNEMNSF